MMPPTTSLTLFTATYYDNYSFKSLAGGLDYVNSDISGQPTSEFLNVNGKPTGAKVNILGSTNYLWSVSYYDDHYRVIQSISQNHKGAADRQTSKYDFAGKVLTSKTSHAISDIQWKDVTGVSTTGSSLTKTDPTGWGYKHLAFLVLRT